MRRCILTFVFYSVMISCLTLTGTVITLLVCSRHNHAPAKWTFGDTTNRTGWSNDGFAFLLVISNSVYSFLGTDSGVHMCEELPEPAKNVPKVVMYPLLFGLLTAFPFTCACMNAITDVETVLDTPSGLPLIEIYYQSTGSKEASSALLALLVFCFFGCWVSTGKYTYHSFPSSLTFFLNCPCFKRLPAQGLYGQFVATMPFLLVASGPTSILGSRYRSMRSVCLLFLSRYDPFSMMQKPSLPDQLIHDNNRT